MATQLPPTAFSAGDRVTYDPSWPMLPKCRQLGTEGVDFVGTIQSISRNDAAPHWDSAWVLWDNGARSPVNLGNLVLADTGAASQGVD